MRTRIALRRRSGISLVEVITALVLVAVGLLGIAGSAALLTRRAADADALHRATRVATLRLALLGAGGCASARAGTSPPMASGHRERWSLAGTSDRARLVRVEVEWPRREGQGRLLLRSALLC